MNDTWILVTNASEARLFETQKYPKKLSLRKKFFHPKSRAKNASLVTDRAGHFQGDSGHTTHGAFNDAAPAKQVEIERFAKTLVSELDVGRNAHDYKKLVIVSSPHFHGLLNKHMNGHVAKMVDKHIEKDYTTLKEKELLKKISSK